MVKRLRLENKGGRYLDERAPVFFSTGCMVLDLAIGGGFPLGRVVNIVGDELMSFVSCAPASKAAVMIRPSHKFHAS